MPEENIKGLSDQQVSDSRQKFGENIITPVKSDPVWKLFLDKFRDPIVKILLVAAALSLIVGIVEKEFAETIGIIVAILLATGISFWFEYDAKKRFDILNVVNDDTPVKAVRNGSVIEIPKKDVVVGDIILVTAGDEVPADGKLLKAVSIMVNESSLTGETVVGKDIGETKDKEATYPSDMLMRGTTMTEGYGTMEVTAVGDSTEYGKVSEQSTIEGGEETPLNKQLNRLSRIIGVVGTILAVTIFLVMMIKGIFINRELITDEWLAIVSILLKYFMVSVAIMVMAVPEGLPMSITLSLAMSMRRMLRTNNLVRKMHACETMGAVTVICTDKTGTLTLNKMSLDQFITYGTADSDAFDRMVAVNSTAYLNESGESIGNPTEGALLGDLYKRDVDYQAIRTAADIIDQITFSTEKKYMATLVAGDNGQNMLYVKGAPEVVIAMCGNIADKKEIEDKLTQFQNQAKRTLGFAYKETSATSCEQAIGSADLNFYGIAVISDPVRQEVPQAIARCLEAGIAVKIVTGDTTTTARQIAREIGLWDDDTDDELSMITGPDFEATSDEELLERLHGLKIMARARPLDKQRLVKLLQRQGEVVAVTGDGTNDAPALNFAQVGLSMGSGTSVAKQASDITLLDDSFGSIATAVMWGRSLYKNIQRFVMFQLTVNFVAIIVVFFGTIFGGQLPLTVTQILWVNIIMDTFAALALASLPPDPRVMEEKPRKETDFIITRPMFSNILVAGSVMVATLLTMLILWGSGVELYQLTAFFTTFVLFQFWNLFNARAFGQHKGTGAPAKSYFGFAAILVAILTGQILIVTFGGEVFRAVPLTIQHWLYIFAGTSLIIVVGSLVRLLQKKKSY